MKEFRDSHIINASYKLVVCSRHFLIANALSTKLIRDWEEKGAENGMFGYLDRQGGGFWILG